MSTKITDVLPPLEEEVLFSWVIRMVKEYADEKFGTSCSDAMRIIFGKNSGMVPGLYFQKGLDYFVENCDLKDSLVFSSKESMIVSLTVLPFYKNFLDESRIKQLDEKTKKFLLYRELYDISGIKTHDKYIESHGMIKFCPECIKEGDTVYLKREHQIQGNYVCWKHGCKLAYYPYKDSWSDIDIERRIKNKDFLFYELSDEEFAFSRELANLIHMVFQKGLQNDISLIKSKIWAKLQESNIVSNNNQFNNLNEFIADLNADYLFSNMLIDNEIVSAISAERITSPIIYLILILRLFGSLENLYAYKSDNENHLEMMSKHKLVRKNYDGVLKSFSDYMNILPKDFFLEHILLGDTDKYLVVRHIPCGSNYCRSKKNFRLKPCSCGKHSIPQDCLQEEQPKKFTHYLTTVQYGERHRKKKKQINNLIHAGRFDGLGVIKAGNISLIPENTPYPKRKNAKK